MLQVTDAYVTLQTAKQQVKVSKKEIETARDALTLAKERYGLGLSSIVDVTTATTDLLSAQIRLAKARYSVQLGVVAMSYAIGRSVQDF